MRVALPPDLGRLQNSSVTELNQDLFPVKLVGMPIVVWFDTANKVRLPCHHLGQQVHQRVLETTLGSLIKPYAAMLVRKLVQCELLKQNLNDISN